MKRFVIALMLAALPACSASQAGTGCALVINAPSLKKPIPTQKLPTGSGLNAPISVVVNAVVDGSGNVVSDSIATSSGNTIVDNAALAVVKAAAFNPPVNCTSAPESTNVTVQFTS